jgi:hypothetical protein
MHIVIYGIYYKLCVYENTYLMHKVGVAGINLI